MLGWIREVHLRLPNIDEEESIITRVLGSKI